MSKSFGNVVDPVQVVDDYGQDQIRYFIMREVPFGNDGDFSKAQLIQRINTDLANDLGNLFQRVLSMVAKNCEGKVPALGELSAEDKAFLNLFDEKFIAGQRDHIANLSFHLYLGDLWERIRAANRYMDAQQPWSLKKDNPEKMAHVLRVLMEGFARIAVLVEPYMPTAASMLQQQITFTGKTIGDIETSELLLTHGTELPKPSGVFMRINAEEAA